MTISFKEAVEIIEAPDSKTFEILNVSNALRQRYKGKQVRLCSIINAKSGRCSENCSFCAQSVHHQTDVDTYPLISAEEIIYSAKNAEEEMHSSCFSIVTSGKSVISPDETKTIAKALNHISTETNLNRCVSLGVLKKDRIKTLKEAGLRRIHHNLETAESFFENICTTHTYAERKKTIVTAKELGLEVCSGGIFGLGESASQRVELAFTLKELAVDSIPLNILNPIPGTKAYNNHHPLSPLEILRTLAVFRMIMPEKDLGLLGGREMALRDLQPLLFMAGANVILIGNYLTTKGQAYKKDLQMINDLGLELEKKFL